MVPGTDERRTSTGWRGALHEVIFEADTRPGKLFDIALIVTIVASIVVVMLESVASIATRFGATLRAAEWVVTALFTVEYVLRLLCVKQPLRYARSFYGVVDLLAILPSYLALVFPSTRVFLVIRLLRVLRVFRVFKLGRYLSEGNLLLRALKASQIKITVFLYTVLTAVVLIGSLMYIIEGPTNPGFDSIPRSIYWAVVTLTTVGYGDISPRTPLGQFFAAAVMILGYGMIAVPTGIVGVEMARAENKPVATQACPSCGLEGHDHDARHCKHCGEKL